MARAGRMTKPLKKKKIIKLAGTLPLPPLSPPLPPEVKMKTPKLPKSVRREEKRITTPFEPSVAGASAEVLERLWAVIEQRRHSGNAATSHSARLLARGTPKVAQKLGEEAVELVIEAVAGDRTATISESADVLYHLMVLWVDANIRPDEVWAELVRREGISGIAEKAARPKALVRLARTTKLP